MDDIIPPLQPIDPKPYIQKYGERYRALIEYMIRWISWDDSDWESSQIDDHIQKIIAKIENRHRES